MFELITDLSEPMQGQSSRIVGFEIGRIEPIGARRQDHLVPLTANRGRKSYAASATGFASSMRHFAMTFATDFEVQLNG